MTAARDIDRDAHENAPAAVAAVLDQLAAALDDLNLSGAVLDSPPTVRAALADLHAVTLHAGQQTVFRKAGLMICRADILDQHLPTLRHTAMAAGLALSRWLAETLTASRAGDAGRELEALAAVLRAVAGAWRDRFGTGQDPEGGTPAELVDRFDESLFALDRAADLLLELAVPPAVRRPMADALAAQAVGNLHRSVRAALAQADSWITDIFPRAADVPRRRPARPGVIN